MKRIIILVVTLLVLIGLGGCTAKPTPGELREEKLIVGVSAGPHEEIFEKVKELAAKEDLIIEVKVFTEYVMPNIALAEGELHVNSFQHKPYLEKFKEDRKLDLVDIASTVNFPMGIYSEKVKSIGEIVEGDKIGLPNDPTNGARALILFESAGLIQLKDGIGVKATVMDIVKNPLNLKFIELEASQIPRQLSELKIAAINSNFAIEHGYVPTKDSIFIESSDAPWVNVIVVRRENKDDPVLEKLIRIYQSEEIKQFIVERFQGSIVPGW